MPSSCHPVSAQTLEPVSQVLYPASWGQQRVAQQVSLTRLHWPRLTCTGEHEALCLAFTILILFHNLRLQMTVQRRL
jgi:hypothetical protein